MSDGMSDDGKLQPARKPRRPRIPVSVHVRMPPELRARVKVELGDCGAYTFSELVRILLTAWVVEEEAETKRLDEEYGPSRLPVVG